MTKQIMTYVTEDPSGAVTGYFRTLHAAKAFAVRSVDTILAMRGSRFGEGFHRYRMQFLNGHFKYTWRTRS